MVPTGGSGMLNRGRWDSSDGAARQASDCMRKQFKKSQGWPTSCLSCGQMVGIYNKGEN